MFMQCIIKKLINMQLRIFFGKKLKSTKKASKSRLYKYFNSVEKKLAEIIF